MQVLGTFQSRDAADAVKDALIADGFAPHSLIVMSNRAMPTPPEDAKLEVGAEGEGGFAGMEEKIGKAVNNLLHKPTTLDGDGFEGEGKDGALLAVTVNASQVERVKELLTRHFAGDIEIAQED